MSGRDEIFARFAKLGIQYEQYTHPPVPAAADRYPMGLCFHAQICKNLLVAPRNESRFLLLMLPVEKSVDLKALRDEFQTARLQFAPEVRLAELLEQKQGCVGVCGVVHDRGKRIEVVFDSALRGCERIAMHPGVNTETVVMPFSELERYVHSNGTKVWFYDF
ncbi:MAG: YbaK/EbsC family protein [Clostridiaceae bacterium]|nr:YbaK/EbsC family protein [Clostridiaceae bacterium]